MDEEDAGDVYGRLQALEQHEGENLHVLKNGMAIIQSNADFLRTALDNITANENAIKERMGQFEALLKSEVKFLSKQLRAVFIQSEINQIVLFLTSKLSQINKYLSDHFAIISSLQQHKLHPLVVATQEIIKAINEMQPYPLHAIMSNPVMIERMVSVSTLSLKEDMIIQIKVPFVQEREYSLNKIYALPIPTSTSGYTILELPEGYLLNNSRASHLIELNERDFSRQCLNLNPDDEQPIHLCNQVQPIHIGPDPENCLLNLFHNPSLDPPRCTHRIGKTIPNRLIKLSHPNTWLLIAGKQRTLTAHCSSETHSIPLSDMAIITLKQPCNFQIDNIALAFERRNTKILEVHQPNTFSIPIFKANQSVLSAIEDHPEQFFNTNVRKNLRIGHQTELNTFFRSNTKSLLEVQQEISRLEVNRQIEKQRKTQKIHGSVLFPFVAIVLIGLITRCIWRVRRQRKGRNIHTPALPMQTIVSLNTTENVASLPRKTQTAPISSIESQPTKKPVITI